MKKRIRLRKNFNFKLKIRDRIIIITIIIFLCSFIFILYLDKFSRNTVLEYVSNEIKLLSTLVINEAIENNIESFSDVENLIYESKNKNDEIVSIDFNTINVNKNLTDLNKSILKNLKRIENGELSSFNVINNPEYVKNNGNIIYYIPVGIVTNNLFLTSIGYKIPLKMNAVGSVVSNIKTDVEEYGINNIVFKMYIEVEITELVLLPFVSEKVKVSVEVPIVIKIIQGKIPAVYGGILTSTSSLNTLNVD